MDSYECQHVQLQPAACTMVAGGDTYLEQSRYVIFTYMLSRKVSVCFTASAQVVWPECLLNCPQLPDLHSALI